MWDSYIFEGHSQSCSLDNCIFEYNDTLISHEIKTSDCYLNTYLPATVLNSGAKPLILTFISIHLDTNQLPGTLLKTKLILCDSVAHPMTLVPPTQQCMLQDLKNCSGHPKGKYQRP